jgi:hypothetical protein
MLLLHQVASAENVHPSRTLQGLTSSGTIHLKHASRWVLSKSPLTEASIEPALLKVSRHCWQLSCVMCI